MQIRQTARQGNYTYSAGRYFKIIATLLFSSMMAACASIPDTLPPPQPENPTNSASRTTFALPHMDWPSTHWWGQFGDSQLDQLMAEALANSPTLAQATARLRSAVAQDQQANAALYPSLEANGSAARQRLSYDYVTPRSGTPRGYNNVARTSLDFNWELDFWGKNRNALKAATSESLAALADTATAQLMLTTALADAYIQLNYLYDQQDIANETLRNRGHFAQLITKRVSQGMSDQTEQEQASARVATAQAALAQNNEQIQLAKNGIAALLGKGPDRGLTITRPTLESRQSYGLPETLNADLLGRNPIVNAARWRVEAAARRVGVARARFYPNVNLMAFIGYQSMGLSELVRPASTIGSVGPAINLPLFEGGALRANYRGARADYDLAVASYNESLTEVLQQTADATRSLTALKDRQSSTSAELAHSTKAYRLAQERYQGGLSDYLSVLSTEDAMLQAQQADNALHARGFSLDVALVKALGGGFNSSSTFESKVTP